METVLLMESVGLETNGSVLRWLYFEETKKKN